MKRTTTSLLLLFIAAMVLSLSSCLRDDDINNYSPTQALPEEQPVPQDSIPDDDDDNPQDTTDAGLDMNWFANFTESPSFYGDSTTFTYAFDSLLLLHEFACVDVLGRQMIISIESLAPGDYMLNFDTNIIRVIDDTAVYDGGATPSGLIVIADTSGGRINATFGGTLTSFNNGANLTISDGLLQNIPIE